MKDTPAEGEPIWAWLHVSDIHAGHGDAAWRADQQLVLAAIEADVPKAMNAGAPKPDAIIVTGDVAATGGKRDPDEYRAATAWLRSLMQAAGTNRIYCVPGNHDVRRTDATSRNPGRLLDGLRDGRDTVEAALTDASDRELLEERFSGYRAFLADVDAPAPGGPAGNWVHEFVANGWPVRLVGMNTALLCNDDHDEERLRIGRGQLAPLARLDDGHIVIALAHHPSHWLDSVERDRLDAYLQESANIFLHGHIHDAGSRSAITGAGHHLITVAAGAVHAEAAGEGVRPPHAYNIAALWRYDDTRLSLCIWHRRWDEKNRRFVADTNNTPEDARYAEHPLPTVKRAIGPARPLTMDDIVTRLSARIGRRRTAFPRDMNISELYERGLLVPEQLRRAGQPTTSQSLDAVLDEIAAGRHVLVLGPPGSGKSVLAYEAARLLGQRGLLPLVIEPAQLATAKELTPDAIAELAIPDEEDLDAILRAGRRRVAIIDGVDEAIAGGSSARFIADQLAELSDTVTVLLTCRQADYDRHLAAVLPGDTFGSILELGSWGEAQFSDFVRRLVDGNLLPDTSLVERVQSRPELRHLVQRPLLARMLTYVASDGGLPESTIALYQQYMGRLGAATDVARVRIGCSDDPPATALWREAAWYVFRNRGLRTDSFPLDAAIGHLRTLDLSAECAFRTLSGILDISPGRDELSATFIHYSFFEFLVAQQVAQGLTAAHNEGDPGAAIAYLRRDLRQEVRRHLTGLLRKTALDLYSWPSWLARVYRIAEGSPTEVRTIRNLLAYITCRLDVPASESLNQLLDEETDPFLQNSLLWALTRCNDVQALERYISSLATDTTLASLNRGYLLYYFGDLQQDEPPYGDDAPYVAWSHTRERVGARFADQERYSTTPAARRAVDLYTFYDMASVRSERLTEHEEAAISLVEKSLAAEEVIPAHVMEAVRRKHDEVRRGGGEH